jgi:hypothetical protein
MVATTLLLTSCNNRRWNDKQRKATREMIEQWRQLAYLNALTEEEFALFAGRVTDVLEEEYPSYVEFVEMPMVGDSVEMVIITTIAGELKATPERMRNIFPYGRLVDMQILPAGLSMAHQETFYRCFTEKVNTLYGSLQRFVWDAIYSRLDDAIILRLMRQCASPYWEVDMVIIEEN